MPSPQVQHAGSRRAEIDWFIFIASALTVYAVCVPLGLFPTEGAEVLNQAFTFVTDRLGVAYVLFSVFALSFLIYLGCSRFGRIRLGSVEQRYSAFSWAAMLFCAGVGAGLLAWAPIEWGYYLDAPPFGAEPRSTEAMEWASTYGIFHWGFTAWAFTVCPRWPLRIPIMSSAPEAFVSATAATICWVGVRIPGLAGCLICSS